MSKPTYSQAEINEIIRRALDKQSEREGHLDHDDLVAIADEVGIDRESLERATAELAQTRDSRLSRQDEAKEIAEERTIQLKRFGATLLSHAIMNGRLLLHRHPLLRGRLVQVAAARQRHPVDLPAAQCSGPPRQALEPAAKRGAAAREGTTSGRTRRLEAAPHHRVEAAVRPRQGIREGRAVRCGCAA
jgi:hypothetical protein